MAAQHLLDDHEVDRSLWLVRKLSDLRWEENFFPSCLPYIHQTAIRTEDNTTNYEARKYYNPLRDFSISSQLYDRILCYALTEGVENCLKK